MAWGDVAKEALAKALEVYEKLAKLAAVVELIKAATDDFRDETRKRMIDFEGRVDQRATHLEARVEQRLERLETRIRELESRMASNEGKTDGAMARAVEVLLREHLAERHLPGAPRPGSAAKLKPRGER